MYGYIYMTTNLINNKKYIGQKKYCKEHEDYLGSGILIKRAVEKYGSENFSKEILEECETRESLNKAEIKWIAKYKAVESTDFYNLARGGEGQLNPSAKIRAKISKSLTGNILSDETKKKMSESHKGEKAWQYGKHLSEEHKKHLSENHCDVNGRNNPNYGKKMSDEQKAKISSSLKGKTYISSDTYSQIAIKNGHPVFCETNNTLYPSARHASRALNLDDSTIRKVCIGKLKSTKGYVFKYPER